MIAGGERDGEADDFGAAGKVGDAGAECEGQAADIECAGGGVETEAVVDGAGGGVVGGRELDGAGELEVVVGARGCIGDPIGSGDVACGDGSGEVAVAGDSAIPDKRGSIGGFGNRE